MSTTSTGNAFREYVCSLLKSKFPDAQPECKAAWKNADIMFTMMELGKRIKVAVECKNYSRALNTSDFSTIIGDYQTAIENGEINLLLVVSNRSVESASRNLIDRTRALRFMTLAELESWLVGLEPYVQALAEEYSTDEVHRYYVEGRFENIDGTAFEHLLTWLNSDDQQNTGMAVLGGYGVGKSSLAKRIASEQAIRYLASPETERLPILIPLGQTVHETELAGLFGKYFTSRFALENYSFKALLHLNAAGRLLIILDGFDEMKHAMTEHDFRSNFREFNKLRVASARVLLLGRPTAFTSESSSLLVRGLATHGGQMYSDADFPAWNEQRLAFFTTAEQTRFLDGFLKYKSTPLAEESLRKQRIDEVMRDIDDDILQRPVQARIVGLLAADPNYNFKGTSRYRLYNDFVQQVIRRDQEKRARSFIPTKDRHKFLRELAWWAWTRPGVSQGAFRREDVPDSLFMDLSSGEAIDHIAKRTEYLVSSLTEEKDSNLLYFAHRSFHEFLVASYITSLSDVSSDTISDLNTALSEQLVEFLNESGEQDYLEIIYKSLNSLKSPPVSEMLLGLLASSTRLTEEILRKSFQRVTPLDVFIVGRSSLVESEGIATWMGQVVSKSGSVAADAASFYFINKIVNEIKPEPDSIGNFLANAWERLLSESFHVEDQEIIIPRERFGTVGEVLKKWTRKIRVLSGGELLLHATEAWKLLHRNMAANGFTGVPQPVARKKLVEIKLESLRTKMSLDAFAHLERIYSIDNDLFLLVRKEIRATKQPRVASKKKA